MPSHQPKRKDAIRTRAALLSAATEAFAHHGYKGTHIRDVCARAGANLGAVHHYFGSKEQLYREALLVAHRDLVDRKPVPRVEQGGDPERALHAWVCYLLTIFLQRRSAHPHAGRLIAWELRDPTPALDELIAEVLGPVRSALEEIVGRLLGDADTPETRSRCANFVHGICVFHDQNQEYLSRVGYEVPTDEPGIAALADAIVAFALAGIARMHSET